VDLDKEFAMKKVLKITLTCLPAVLAFVICLLIYRASPLLAMKPIKTGTELGDVLAIKNGRGNVFLMDSGEGYLMIDAGSNAAKLEASLQDLGIAPDDVKWIFLTHADYDHTGGLTLFPRAMVIMGEDEYNAMGKPPRNNKFPEGAIGPVNFLRDNELFYCGLGVQAIHAPGHTAGSMAYLVDGQYLFTGDAMRIGKEPRTHPFTDDQAQAEESLNMLMELPWTMLLTSHYGYSIKE